MDISLMKDIVYFFTFLLTLYGVFKTNRTQREKSLEDHMRISMKLDNVIETQRSVEKDLQDIKKVVSGLEQRVTRLEARVYEQSKSDWN